MCITEASAERCIDEHFSFSFFVTAREQSMLVRHSIVLHSTVSQEFSVYPPFSLISFYPSFRLLNPVIDVPYASRRAM